MKYPIQTKTLNVYIHLYRICSSMTTSSRVVYLLFRRTNNTHTTRYNNKLLSIFNPNSGYAIDRTELYTNVIAETYWIRSTFRVQEELMLTNIFRNCIENFRIIKTS